MGSRGWGVGGRASGVCGRHAEEHGVVVFGQARGPLVAVGARQTQRPGRAGFSERVAGQVGRAAAQVVCWRRAGRRREEAATRRRWRGTARRLASPSQQQAVAAPARACSLMDVCTALPAGCMAQQTAGGASSQGLWGRHRQAGRPYNREGQGAGCCRWRDCPDVGFFPGDFVGLGFMSPCWKESQEPKTGASPARHG